MQDKIKINIHLPEELEKLYRSDSQKFETGFKEIYAEFENDDLVNFWRIRLAYDKAGERIKSFQWADIALLIATCLITSFFIKLPDLFTGKLPDYQFYQKNAGIIVLFGLSIFAFWTNKITDPKKIAFIVTAFIVTALYINLLPSDPLSQSLNLAFIHLPILMWFVYGIVYINFDMKDKRKRIDYIIYNGDVAVLGAVILAAGGILAVITVGLFSAIGISIERFYMEYVAICGVASAPVVATYIIQNFPTFTNKIAPIIAKIFSPLVLVTLVIYVFTLAVSGKNPYNSRDILIIFNLMLLGVMAIIIFSISEISIYKKQRFNEMILFILSGITLIIDLVALSAIFYRLNAYGITPNRIAVLVSNLLISGNLVLIMMDLYRVNFRKAMIGEVEFTISKYLPLYAIYAFFIVFGFPLIFSLR